MIHELAILVLAGKQIASRTLDRLESGDGVMVARLDSVSRGVRRLEYFKADVVVLLPGKDDTTHERAIRRALDEYGTWSILIGTGERDIRAGRATSEAYAVFQSHDEAAACLDGTLGNLKRQLETETALLKSNKMLRWLEQSGRFGSWTTEASGDAEWSEGLQHIFKDTGELTADFSSVRPFVHPEDLAIFDQANRSTFQEGWPLDFEYRIITGHHDTRYLRLHRNVDFGRDGKVARVYGMLHDITPEREFEEFLLRRDAILQVTGRMAERFLRNMDWQHGLNDYLAALGKAAEVSRAFLFRLEGGGPATARFTMTHEWAADPVPSVLGTPLVEHQSFSPVFDRWRLVLGDRKIVAGNVRSFQADERRFFKDLKTQAVMLAPVFEGDEWWGILGLSESRWEREWMPGEIESVKMMADMLGAAVLRDRMDDELKAANRAAEEARLDAMEASRSKSRFLANMSHEIRTPISGILGMSEMLISTGLSSTQRENMNMILGAARSLLSIVNDILDISKIEADKLELKPENFDIRALVETTANNFAPLMEKKRLTLNHLVDEDIPDVLYGDADRLGQVLRNLIGNALKFTEQGQIDVSVRSSRRKNGRIRLSFEVRDTGEGIPKTMLDAIFNSFTQADSSVHKKYQGTGLGLTISRELVRMMEGDIQAQSEQGKGSTFTFTVWLEVPAETVRPHTHVQPVATGQKQRSILLAEDNPLNQKFLSHFLTQAGHTVTVVENGHQALETLGRLGRGVDLILMDIQMPEMSGLEATRAIRESDGRLFDSSVPIIALTAYAMKGDRQRMVDAGMDDYVSKPVDMKELTAAIDRALARSTDERDLLHDAAGPATATPGQPSAIDMDGLISRFDGNMPLLNEILTLFLTEAENRLSELNTALEREDMKKLGAAIHSIANMTSHVMAMGIMRTAQKLEQRCYREALAEVAPAVADLKPRFEALIDEVRHKAESL